MAEKSGSLREAVMTLRQLSEDEQIKLQCEAREMYEMDQSAQLTLRQRAREEGYNAGVEKEHINTVREKQRADIAEKELEKVEKELAEIKKQLMQFQNK